MVVHATHPRDRHVQYQQHLQRQLEGDVVDTSGEDKVTVALQQVTATSSVATVTFAHEDHTLGNILRHVLMQNPDVTSAGYAIPHPLEPRMVVHVQSAEHVVDVVQGALEEVAMLCDKTLANFDAATEAAAQGH
uniref:DNA-directed RNA polymerase RBP11-like dimerisation domain-containing protein n=1 Tax=Neobodo designis TaxID=312471 RepID=A0A7S1Q5C5_NEODS|mmetsp:Transcript_30775/g.95065  ORF Transcript_30775/g.95065 Transcript_30775/m.95065 type:complete len:134 (+) Transcript_30775:40-441(+)